MTLQKLQIVFNIPKKLGRLPENENSLFLLFCAGYSFKGTDLMREQYKPIEWKSSC